VEGNIAHQPLLVSENRLNTLSCNLKFSTVSFFISSQSTRVTDGQTERQTNGQEDRQNYDPQDRASIAASPVEIWLIFLSWLPGPICFAASIFLRVSGPQNPGKQYLGNPTMTSPNLFLPNFFRPKNHSS